MIETRSLVEQVYAHLLGRITTGAIRYGETLDLKRIADELGVSTMPVREAVKRLEYERVVSIKPRSSCRVCQPSGRTISDVYELRIALEYFAVGKCRGKLPPRARGRLHAIVDAMRSLQREPDTPARRLQAIALDREFHTEICSLAGNDFLDAIYRQLTVHVNMTLIHARTYRQLKPGWAEVHAEILRCLEHEPSRAVPALQRHFANVTALLGQDGTPPRGVQDTAPAMRGRTEGAARLAAARPSPAKEQHPRRRSAPLAGQRRKRHGAA